MQPAPTPADLDANALARLVAAFYAKVRQDALLGPVFNAAITDWPPSEPLHLSWKDAFPAVLDRVSRELTARPPVKAGTLVVAPYRGLMAKYEPWELLQTNQHNASTFPDTSASRINTAFLATLEQLKADGITYDITDERTLEEDGELLPDGRVRLGQADDVRDVAEQERHQAGDEQVLRQHQEHVTGQRADQRHHEPRAQAGMRRMQGQHRADEHHHGRRLADVLERAVVGRHGDPVEDRDRPRDHEEHPRNARHRRSG